MSEIEEEKTALPTPQLSYSYNTEVHHLAAENMLLKDTVNKLNEELQRMKTPALLVAEVHGVTRKGQAIIKFPNGNRFLCYIHGDVPLRAGDHVLVEQRNLNIIGKVPLSRKHNVEQHIIIEKPQESWGEIGGLHEVVQEVREVIELPLKSPELFQKVGIKPPKGILLHGEPGTGKTLVARAAAHATNATFIEIVASELVQKFIGEGAKLVKELFELARRKAPAIIFIDEIDAIAAKRMEIGTSGEREVNRTFMQLLAELDGFTNLENVKVIAATNRKDLLDPAILRAGRLDRAIAVGLPDEQGRAEILKIHMHTMNVADVRQETIAIQTGGFSGAELRAVCTEAGYFAIRDGREKVTHEDFLLAVEKVKKKMEEEEGEKENIFG